MHPRISSVAILFLVGACSADPTDGLDGGPKTCATNDDCIAAEWCSGGMCIAGTGNACEDDTDCAANETCDIVDDCGASRCSGNTCVPAGCESAEDCNDGFVCVDSVCTAPPACSDENPCPGDLICEEGECRAPNVGPCDTDDDCEVEGEICVMGECGEPVPCTDADDCEAGQQCFQDVCRDPCTEDAQCDPPLFRCDLDTNECRPGCFNDGQCDAGTICEGFLCVDAECTDDSDCDVQSNEECVGEENDQGRCVQFEPCGMNNECPAGSICNETTNRCDPIPACRTDRDCPGDAYCDGGFCIPADSCANMSCAAGFECIDDICVPAPCRADTDCTTAGEICIGGVCQTPPSTDFVTEVRIVSPAGYVRPASTYRFVAIALDQAGRAVPGVSFDWTSSDVDVATIDTLGVATGGAMAGATSIRASVTTAIGPVQSLPVTLTNLGPLNAGDVRVTVQSLATGAPVAMATVELTAAAGPLTMTTDASGTVVFAGAGAADYTVTAAHASFDWMTVVSPTSDDLVLALPALSATNRAAGVKGDVDLSNVTSVGAISLSLSGASMPSPLLAFDAGMLFGNGNFDVDIPMIGSVSLPAANTVAVEFMGFPLDLKDTYYAEAQPGLRALWSFGGRIELGTNGINPADFQNFLAAVLPFYQRFEHAVLPAVPLVSLPHVVDTNDIDGDGDTTEELPDWNAFPSRTLVPRTAQNLRYQLAVAPLPFVSGGNANTLIVVSGTIVPGLGFVPLGMDGQSDSMGNGIVSSFVTKMAPRHSGLEAGDYAVMAIAIRAGMNGLGGPGSIRLFTTPRLPTSVNMADGWLDSPVGVTYNATSRTVTAGNILGADLYRASFVTTDGGWHVYAAPSPDGLITLPAAPAGLTDRGSLATVSFDVVDLEASANASALFDAGNGGVQSIDRVTRGVARAVVAP